MISICKLFSFIKKNQNLVIFILTTILFTFYGYLFSPRTFYFDSGNYWGLRESFIRPEGDFSIFNYKDTLRGYLFPLMLLMLDNIFPSQFFSDYQTIVIFNSLIMAAIPTFLIPAIVSSVTSLKFEWYQRIAVSLLLFVFWRGYIFYPLSDFPSFLFLLIAAYFFIRMKRDDNASSLQIKTLSLSFFAGAAFCIRPVYVISIVGLAFGVVYKSILIYYATRYVPKLIASMAGFLLGVAIIVAPQYLINRNNLNTNSPFITDDLYSFQVTMGLKIQKYETNINTRIYEKPQVYFLDPQIDNLFHREENSKLLDIVSFGSITTLFVKYPLDMITIYFRHLFNGLNITYPTPYVHDIYRLDLLGMIVNYSIIFSVLFLFWLRNVKIYFSDLLFTTISIVAPVLVALPGAVEVRFFLPLHLLNYSVFAMLLGNPGEVWQRINKDRTTLIRTVIFYIVFIIASLSFSAMIATTIPNSTILLTDVTQP